MVFFFSDDIKEREEEVQKLKALGLDEHTECL